MGFKPTRHGSPVQLEGYTGDRRTQTAEIIIPRKQVGAASNDIGFKQQADGTFTAIISDYDSRTYNADWLKTVKLHALEAKARRIAEQHGDLGTPTREVLPDGKVRLRFVQQGV
jgi:hypothetical protein